MYEVFVLVQKAKSPLLKFLAWICLCLAITCVALGCITIYIFPFAFVFGGLFYLFWFRCNKEFEYSYFDGDIRFAKVMNKSRRKNLKSYSAEDLIQIAPAGDRSVSNYEYDANVKKINYTSHKKDTPYYDMVIRTPEGIDLFMVELDDAYLDAVCIKYASKVIRNK